jgi:hypothetical protein
VNTSPSIDVLPEIEWDRLLIAPTGGRARGVELSLARHDAGRTDWSVSYALSSATETIEGREVPRAIDQRHAVQADWSFTPASRKWRLAVAGVWRSGWPYTPELVRLDTIVVNGRPATLYPTWLPGERNSERLPSYDRVDVRWTRYFDLRSGRLAFFAEVYNLFDSANARGYYTNVDINGLSGRRHQESGQFIPRIPAVGLTWEFGSAGR